MKNKIIIYALCLLAGLCQSCVQDIDDVFDASASERINQALVEYRELLCGAENGWVMEYYPSDIQEYGGYVIVMKFDKDKVTMSSEITGSPTEAATSLYSLKSDMGPTLNFDTYNEILHYFSDPDNASGAGIGKGFEGDYEFVLQEAAENVILLKGKKTKNLIHMTRLAIPAEEYLEKIIKIGEEMFTTSYQTNIDGLESTVKLTDHKFTFVPVGSKGIAAPYIITPEGMKFYNPVTVAGKTMENFVWDNAAKTMTCVDAGATDVVLTANPLPDSYIRFEDFLGKWTLSYSDNSVEVELVETIKNQLITMKGFNSHFDVAVPYDPSTGTIQILSQAVSQLPNGNAVWLCAWDANAGTLFANTKIGMVSSKQVNSPTLKVDFVDNGVWGENEANSLILWEMKGTNYVGGYTAWGSNRFVGYFSMIKK